MSETTTAPTTTAAPARPCSGDRACAHRPDRRHRAGRTAHRGPARRHTRRPPVRDAGVVRIGRGLSRRRDHAARLGPACRTSAGPSRTGRRGRGSPGHPHRPERTRAAAEADFVDRLRERLVDLAVQLHGGGAWPNPSLRQLNPRVSIGSRAEGAAPLDRDLAYRFYQNEVLRALGVVGMACAPPVVMEPRVEPTPPRSGRGGCHTGTAGGREE